mmetsp:Transcript_20025/g.26105  ORF Transcript_20025/g.26105 Transcript_20025/m.26105 type:complete len:295 (+) Transcript_20025:48-932(+)
MIPASSSRLIRLSPDGVYVAAVESKTKLTIYERQKGNQNDLVVSAMFTCQDSVDYIQWSPDSELVFAAQLKAATVQIYSPEQPDFRCKITEGVAGLTHVLWAPSSRHLLTFADFNLHITIWNLESQTSLTILKPKTYQAISFSNDNQYLAIATRSDCKDSIQILNCHSENWEVFNTFQLNTLDLLSIQWSPDNSSIIIQESCLRHLCLIYSPFGDLIGKYSAYNEALGIRMIKFNKLGTFLSIGNFDQSIRILNTLTWQENYILKHDHPKTLLSSSSSSSLLLLYSINILTASI